ncbi:type I-E CRISPR-associated protein Cas5/CasD [Leucobacter insecticola]|uniref:Type I-E CRISPR-associated protein Cas5/CasD n=1 Tax=Leucobacter insecticola TaxID=2714934 RepID=A0A6G8FI81_9MICO|nr:type I-E CRISPR-associated protein Cas5/CasD [Leucobacter insecticola]QIM15752.1 type I-E CRISPR-associated protein Cas5/CasD [Leucobacter insecticola]
MSSLLLDLSGPLQSWGNDSRFVRRETKTMPSKSGIVGLLAAALGRRRTDPVEDLVALRFGVRQDQQGKLVRDFQTEIDYHSGPNPQSKALTYRYYLADARYLAVVEAERSLLEGLAEAIQSPVFPLYLGRRACPPTGRIVRGIEEAPLEDVLQSSPWLAAEWYRQKQPRQVQLMWSRDADPGEPAHETLRDLPRSFDPRHRDYGLRGVVHGWTQVANPDGRSQFGADDSSHDVEDPRTKPTTPDHDPMAALGGEA